ncbi:MAG: hypothetical protein WCG75_05560, partial [Armatimonadota bacterium]
MSKKLIANNPKRWEGYRCAAKADFFLGNANEALGYIRSAIERAPEATKAALKLGEQEILVLRDFNVAVASGKEKQNYGQYSASAIDFAKAFHTMPQKVAIGILSADMYHAAKDLTGEKAMLQEVCGRPEVSKTLQEQLLARLQTLVKLEGEQKEKELAKQKELDEQNRRA